MSAPPAATWLLVAGDFTPLGGMDAANYALARYLSTRDQVHLVTHRAWPDLAARPSVTLHPVWRPFNRHLLGQPLLAETGRRVWRRLHALGAHAVVNGGNCGLPVANWVHYLHAADPVAPIGSAARRAKATVARRHDLAGERRALRAARLVICNSRRTSEDVVRRIGVDPALVRVIYYGSDPVRFSFVRAEERTAARQALSHAPGRPLVGFVGALGDRRKAFDTVFDAWAKLCGSRDWDADLVVVGQGAELPVWRQRTREAGLDDRIRFLGFRKDVPEILAALDGMVHPARYEAYGLAVHEALCRGVPTFVSASAGVAERYPPTLGGLLLADPDDAEELRAKLLWWRRELEPLRAAVAPFSDALRRETWDAMARQIADCLAQPS
jgi:glycosyltransferase involved in cell wall biosynthesis